LQRARAHISFFFWKLAKNQLADKNIVCAHLTANVQKFSLITFGLEPVRSGARRVSIVLRPIAFKSRLNFSLSAYSLMKVLSGSSNAYFTPSIRNSRRRVCFFADFTIKVYLMRALFSRKRCIYLRRVYGCNTFGCLYPIFFLETLYHISLKVPTG